MGAEVYCRAVEGSPFGTGCRDVSGRAVAVAHSGRFFSASGGYPILLDLNVMCVCICEDVYA